MSTNTPGPDRPPQPQTSTTSPAWLRTPVTVTVERWILVAAGVAALVLLLLALD